MNLQFTMPLHLEKVRITNLWLSGKLSTEDYKEIRDFLLAVMYPGY